MYRKHKIEAVIALPTTTAPTVAPQFDKDQFFKRIRELRASMLQTSSTAETMRTNERY